MISTTRQWFDGTYGEVELRIDDEDARYATPPGVDATNRIAKLCRMPMYRDQLDSLDAEAVRRSLAEYGAWNDAELADDEENLRRIFWIACGDIADRPGLYVVV